MNSVQTQKNQNDLERSIEAPPDFVERVWANQRKLASELKSHYHFIACGSGSSGSVIPRRLAEKPRANVLLLWPTGMMTWQASLTRSNGPVMLVTSGIGPSRLSRIPNGKNTHAAWL
jgi:hypothetical protein